VCCEVVQEVRTDIVGSSRVPNAQPKRKPSSHPPQHKNQAKTRTVHIDDRCPQIRRRNARHHPRQKRHGHRRREPVLLQVGVYKVVHRRYPAHRRDPAEQRHRLLAPVVEQLPGGAAADDADAGAHAKQDQDAGRCLDGEALVLLVGVGFWGGGVGCRAADSGSVASRSLLARL